jgi:hypothetical protein
MSSERYTNLIVDLCATVGLGDDARVLRTRSIEVEGSMCGSTTSSAIPPS